MHQFLFEKAILVAKSDDENCLDISALSLRDEKDRKFIRNQSLIEQVDDLQKPPRGRRTSFVEGRSIYYPYPASKLSSKDIVLRRCKQSEPLPFDEIYSESNLRKCHKIGEGVYGEVFMNKTAAGDAVVLKIIPIEGEDEINGSPQKRFDEILSEIIIAMELSSLRNAKDYVTSGFVELINVRCIKGQYPEHLIDKWDLYDENHDSENDRPSVFKEDQLYIVLELANAGTDLEAFQFENAAQAHSAFLQVALTLAIAEKKFQFEHRDLHWGNILLKKTDQREITYKLGDDKTVTIPTFGVLATIIDFTLSRMVFNDVCFYNDLTSDPELFEATGDYQFDIYRLMRDTLDNAWACYNPKTNVLWLHYTIDKMINGARYISSKTARHRQEIGKLMDLRDKLLDYSSAYDFAERFDTSAELE